MVKSELIRCVTAKLQYLSRQDVELGINRVLECMTETLCKRDRIEIRGFGSIEVRFRGVRNAHNPKSGTKVLTKPKYIPHFKPGKEMRERVNAAYGQPMKKDDVGEDDES
jgi:integration host factor subunit beta